MSLCTSTCLKAAETSNRWGCYSNLSGLAFQIFEKQVKCDLRLPCVSHSAACSVSICYVINEAEGKGSERQCHLLFVGQHGLPETKITSFFPRLHQ